jgi:hypothetical protein
VSWPCHSKHFFGAKHLEEVVKPVLLSSRNKSNLSVWRKSTKSSACPSVWFGEDELCYICFGCNTVKNHLPRDHLSDCPHAEKHLAVLKRLIGEDDGASEPAINSREVEALKSELEKVKKELKALAEKDNYKDIFIKGMFGKRYSQMTQQEVGDIYDRKITYIKPEPVEEEEEEEEDDDTLEEFLKRRRENWTGWWSSHHYTYEMYLEDKKKCRDTDDNGYLVWKLSRWYEQEQDD